MYFFGTEDQQSVKIGHCSGNLYYRGKAINNGCPQGICDYPIGVIICEDKADMIKTEKALHIQFKAYRTRGEWFELTDEISDYIREFTDTESGKAFVEEDGKNYRKNYRKRYQNDPEYRERILERDRERYQNDPEYRERRREGSRERYQNDPEIRERRNEHQRKRYQNDPEHRERRREYSQRPEVKERRNKRNQGNYARKKRENQPINGQQLTFLE